jgi:hypothetical protein
MCRSFSLEDLKGRHHMGDIGVDEDDSVDVKERGFEDGNMILLA